jgi:hypothetical protein
VSVREKNGSATQFNNSTREYMPCSKHRASANDSNSDTIIGLLNITWELLQKELHRVEGNCSYHREENKSGS